jgi:hypothetical protein
MCRLSHILLPDLLLIRWLKRKEGRKLAAYTVRIYPLLLYNACRDTVPSW